MSRRPSGLVLAYAAVIAVISGGFGVTAGRLSSPDTARAEQSSTTGGVHRGCSDPSGSQPTASAAIIWCTYGRVVDDRQLALKLRTRIALASSALRAHRKAMSRLGSTDFGGSLRSAGMQRLDDKAGALVSAAKTARVAVGRNQKPLFPRGRGIAVAVAAIAHTLGIEGF